ncbi:hypothetical protein ACWTU6_27665, partial [Mesorhizobium sp. BHbsci]
PEDIRPADTAAAAEAGLRGQLGCADIQVNDGLVLLRNLIKHATRGYPWSEPGGESLSRCLLAEPKT